MKMFSFGMEMRRVIENYHLLAFHLMAKGYTEIIPIIL
jgi:hypothetical protein